MLFTIVTPYLFLGTCARSIDYVTPFIGTEGTVPGTAYNGGITFPGAAVPFGMVKLGLTQPHSTQVLERMQDIHQMEMSLRFH